MRNELALGLAFAACLLLATLFELFPLFRLLNGWVAPWLLVMVVFWSLHTPAIAGVGVAWVAGVFLDAASAAPLGTHALIFTLAGALTLAARRLLLALSVIQQALWMALLALMQQGILALILPSASSNMLAFVQTGVSSIALWLLLHVLLDRWIRAHGGGLS